jgi:hypothetical protein
MGRSVDVALNYVNNLVASQMRLNADAFLFASYNVKTRADCLRVVAQATI